MHEQNESDATRTRVITWKAPVVDRGAIAALSGLEYLQQLVDSKRGVPIAELMNLELVRIAPGEAVFAGTPAEYHYNPIGSVHGGFAATLLDSALGCAIHTTLQAGIGYTTVELKVNYVRAIRMTTGRVTCTAHVIHVGNQIGTSEARITDSQGKLYAHGSTTCMIFPVT
jgi:uncharacterized protein (TIGR00369 family)